MRKDFHSILLSLIISASMCLSGCVSADTSGESSFEATEEAEEEAEEETEVETSIQYETETLTETVIETIRETATETATETASETAFKSSEAEILSTTEAPTTATIITTTVAPTTEVLPTEASTIEAITTEVLMTEVPETQVPTAIDLENVEATTKYTTAMAHTTEAPTTEAPIYVSPENAPNDGGIYVFEKDHGTCIRAAGEYAFNDQNRLRAEKGIYELKWDEELYNYACASASALGHYAEENGVDAAWSLNHDLTSPYRKREVVGQSGTYMVIVPENLQRSMLVQSINEFYNNKDFVGAANLANSPGHMEKVYENEYYTHAAAAVYLMKNSDAAFMSFVYWNENEADFW